jgi:hypothetical protein
MNRTKAIKEFSLCRAVGGSAALCKSPAEVQHATALSKFQIAYWKRKVIDEDFHPQSWGGKSYSKFNDETQHFIEAFIWGLCQRNPTLRIQEYCSLVSQHLDAVISPSWLKLMFKHWRW